MKYVVSQIEQPWLVFFLLDEKGIHREAVGSGNLINEITKNFLLSKEEAERVIKISKSTESINFFGQLRLEITEVKNWNHYIQLKGLRGKF